MPQQPSPADLLACAHDLADAAGAAIRPHFRRPLDVLDKAAPGLTGHAAFDPVTIADRAAETAIAERLAMRFPDHGLIGEEFGTTNGAARYRWVVDPIDGTRAFIMGLPTWGTLIGLLDGDTPVLGVMDQPFTGERYVADGASARLHHAGTVHPLRTRACATLADAVLSSTHPDLFDTPQARTVHEHLKARARMTRYGGDCYAYCLLAAGHLDAIVEPGLQIYDIVALIPIIERAGGRVSTWSGEPATSGGDIVACGDARVHAEILALIAAA